jgi:hypothetical protein
MYNFIINPNNNKKVFSNSSLGKEIIKNYVINMNGGSGIIDNALSLFGLNDIDIVPDNFGDIGDLENPDNWSARERRARLENPIINSQSQRRKARKNWAKLTTSNIQKKIVEQLQILNTANFEVDLINIDYHKHESGIIDFKLKNNNNWIKSVWTREWFKSPREKGESYYNYSNLIANKKKINFFNGNSLKAKPEIETYTGYMEHRKFSRFFLYDVFYLEELDSQIIKYLIELVRLRSINSICPQNIKLEINLTKELQFKSFDLYIKESNIEINYDENYYNSDFCSYLDPNGELENTQKFLKKKNYDKLIGMNTNGHEGPGKCLLNILNNCGKKYNKLFFELTIDDDTISSHANFLIFERNRVYKGKEYKVERDENNNIIWNVFRYDPNGDFYREIDDIFKNNIFKNITWINYKGLLYDIIYTNFSELYPDIISRHYTNKFNIIRNIGIKEENRQSHYLKEDAVYNPSGTCNILTLYLIILSIWNTLIPINRLLEHILMKMGEEQKQYFRLNEELLIRFLYELLYTQSLLHKGVGKHNIKMPVQNIYYNSENWEGSFDIINDLIREIAESPILTDNDGRKIEPVFNKTLSYRGSVRSSDLSMNKFNSIHPYTILENITYIKELLKLKIIVEYEDYEYQNEERIEYYYKVVNIELLKNASVLINNKLAKIINRMSDGYYKIKFNDSKKTKKVKFSDIKLDPDIDWDHILLTLKLIDIIKPYMRYTPVTFDPQDAIINQFLNVSTSAVRIHQTHDELKSSILEGIIVKNYYNGIFKILTHDRYYYIHIDNISDRNGGYIYTIDNNGNIHIPIYDDTLLENWGINKWVKTHYGYFNFFGDETNKYVKYYYKIP